MLLLIPVFVAVSLFLPGYPFFRGAAAQNGASTPRDFLVAFIGDQGLGSGARAVLHLIKNEGAAMVLHQGDFDYEDDPETWTKMLDEILGPNFPYFASIGNHDVEAWPRYQRQLQARLERIAGATCTGDLGVKAACTYQGLLFLLSGAGTLGSDHETYLRKELAAAQGSWRICSWHKNQRLMQVGHKEDEVGWGPYEECRKGGAIIATAHEHSYARTHLIGNFATQEIVSTAKQLRIAKGQTFAFVSGLGGRSIREQDDQRARDPWWATIYTADQGANFGALFCAFNSKGIENEARCYFKDIDGKIGDEFSVRSDVR